MKKYYYTIKNKEGKVFSTFVMNTKVDLPVKQWCDFEISGENGEETNLYGLLEEITKKEYEKMNPKDDIEDYYGDDY